MVICVCIPSRWDQMKYSSVSVAIDQSSAAPMMDTTALIAPPMPSVSLTHTLLHSHSFIYLSPVFFYSLTPKSAHSLAPSNSAAHKQKQITDLMKLSWERSLPGGAFVSRLLTAAAVAHLSHLTDSDRDDSS